MWAAGALFLCGIAELLVLKFKNLVKNVDVFVVNACCHCSLKFGEVLGEGAFGLVMKAEAYGLGGGDDSKVVAVKMLKGHHRQVSCKMTVHIVSAQIRLWICFE